MNWDKFPIGTKVRIVESKWHATPSWAIGLEGVVIAAPDRMTPEGWLENQASWHVEIHNNVINTFYVEMELIIPFTYEAV